MHKTVTYDVSHLSILKLISRRNLDRNFKLENVIKLKKSVNSAMKAMAHFYQELNQKNHFFVFHF